MTTVAESLLCVHHKTTFPGYTWNILSLPPPVFKLSQDHSEGVCLQTQGQLSGHLHTRHESGREWKAPPLVSKKGYVLSQRPSCVVRWAVQKQRQLLWQYWLPPTRSPGAAAQPPAGGRQDRWCNSQMLAFQWHLWPWYVSCHDNFHILDLHSLGPFMSLVGSKTCDIQCWNSLHPYGVSKSEVSASLVGGLGLAYELDLGDEFTLSLRETKRE